MREIYVNLDMINHIRNVNNNKINVKHLKCMCNAVTK